MDVQLLAAVGQLAMALELFLVASEGVGTVAGAAGGVSLDDEQMVEDTGDFGGDGIGTSTGQSAAMIQQLIHARTICEPF